MAWDNRGGRRYFYRSQRIGGTVRRVYCGTGARGEQAEQELAQAQARRAKERQAMTALEAKLTPLVAMAEELEDGIDALVQAVLQSNGFHEHKGQWRRLRGT